MSQSTWTPERNETLKTMRAQNISFARIAKHLGISEFSVKRRWGRILKGVESVESIWTDERVATLKKLAKAGKSSGEISIEMHLSRSTVAAKAHREKIKLRPMRKPKTKRVEGAKPATLIDPASVFRARQRGPLPIVEPTVTEGVTLMDLRVGQCRWPKGLPEEPARFFCGEPTKDERCSYCATHYARSVDRSAGGGVFVFNRKNDEREAA